MITDYTAGRGEGGWGDGKDVLPRGGRPPNAPTNGYVESPLCVYAWPRKNFRKIDAWDGVGWRRLRSWVTRPTEFSVEFAVRPAFGVVGGEGRRRY